MPIEEEFGAKYVCPSQYCESKNQKVCNGYCMYKSETPPKEY